MRTGKHIKNYLSAILRYVLTFFFSFYTRKLYVDVLGVEYLGVEGVMNGVLGMLSLAELGIGTSIVFSLYRPLAEGNQQKVHLLVSLYRRLYRYVALLVLLIGVLLMPFLTFFAPELQTIPHYEFVYLLFLANSVIPYFFAYNSTLYTASQRGYVIQNIRNLFYVLTMSGVVLILWYIPNYILVTACTLVFTVAGQLVVYAMAHRRWTWLATKAEGKLESADTAIIKKNVRAMVFHKVGSYVIHGTSGLIIAHTMNLVSAGLYLNYHALSYMGRSVITEFFNAMTAGLGELIALEKRERVYAVFQETNFLAFFLFGLLSLLFYHGADIFVRLWLGEGYGIPAIAVLFLALDTYVMGMRVPCAVFKSGAGLFANDQYVPLIQSVLNLVLGFSLVICWGVAGVAFSVLLSGLVTMSWYGAYVIYRDFFGIGFGIYLRNFMRYTLVLLGVHGLLCLIRWGYEPTSLVCNLLYTTTLTIVLFSLVVLALCTWLPGGLSAIHRLDRIKQAVLRTLCSKA